MSAHDVCRPDGGPLERNHMKGMVQRNSMESVALTKISRHLETERKAFVRQSTRDEDEMKHLLQRLQVKQQMTVFEDWTDSDDDVIDEDEVRTDTGAVINPYPITIVPKFGASVNSAKLTSPQTRLANPCHRDLNKPTRRKSDEYDVIHDSMSIVTSSATSISDHHSNFDDITIESLASPNAISSVRRLRKTVPEQMQRKFMIRSNSDMSWGPDVPSSPSSPMSHSRSNSLKERKKSTCSTIAESSGFDGESSRVGRRGSSLKERKSGNMTEEKDQKKLLRSYSMVTRPSSRDTISKNEAAFYFKKHQKQGVVECEPTRSNNVTDDSGQTEQCRPIIRKNSKKNEKLPLERKVSK